VFAGIFPALSESGSVKKLAVIGICNEIDDPRWDNQLIGQGLADLLFQGLCDTGQYIGVEQNPRVIDEILRLRALQWDRKSPFYQPADAERISRKVRADAVAYAKVKDFSLARQRFSIGPFGGGKTKVTVLVEVYLKEAGGVLKRAQGKGEASTKQMGSFFQLREDKVYFDETTVGQAAQEAVKRAIDKL
jgi:hypothetical protein